MSDFALRKAQDPAGATALPSASITTTQGFGAKPVAPAKPPPAMLKNASPAMLQPMTRVNAHPFAPAIKPLLPPVLPPPPLPAITVALIKGASKPPMHHTVKANNGSAGGGTSGRHGAISWQREGGQNSQQFQKNSKIRRTAKPSRAFVEKKSKLPRSADRNVDRMVRVLQIAALRRKVKILFRHLKRCQ